MPAATWAGPEDAQAVSSRRAVPGEATVVALDPWGRTHSRTITGCFGGTYSTFVRAPTRRIVSVSSANAVDFVM